MKHRYQVVWWGLRDWGLFIWRPKGNWAKIFRWAIRIGPLEIRRCTKGADDE